MFIIFIKLWYLTYLAEVFEFKFYECKNRVTSNRIPLSPSVIYNTVCLRNKRRAFPDKKPRN